MSAIRVAFDVGPLAGRRTGIGVAVGEMCTALTGRDDVALRPYLTSFRARSEPGVTRLPIPAAVAHRCWSRSDVPHADRWLGEIDVVHGTNYVVPPVRVPRIVSVYDCWFLDHPKEAVADVRRAGRVLRRSVERGAIVHASSHATAAAVRRHFPDADVEAVHLAAMPLAPASTACPIPEVRGRDYVLSVATLERRKNLPSLVAAFGIAATEHDVLLVLAGADGDDRRAVDQAILALPPKVGQRVLLTGFVPDDARTWLLHHARALAYPSLDEGFGFPLLDAMQAGTPIVASDVGSIPEVAGDAALTCAPTDVDTLAAHLLVAIEDDAARARLLEAAAARLASFDWTRTADGLAALYRRVAERGSS